MSPWRMTTPPRGTARSRTRPASSFSVSTGTSPNMPDSSSSVAASMRQPDCQRNRNASTVDRGRPDQHRGTHQHRPDHRTGEHQNHPGQQQLSADARMPERQQGVAEHPPPEEPGRAERGDREGDAQRAVGGQPHLATGEALPAAQLGPHLPADERQRLGPQVRLAQACPTGSSSRRAPGTAPGSGRARSS